MALTSGDKKRIIFCACAFLAVAGLATFYGFINATPTLTIAPRSVTPVPNGLDLAHQAARQLTAPNPPLESSQDAKPPTDAKARAKRYGLARKDAWLKQNKAAFAQLKRAQHADWLQPRPQFGDVSTPDHEPIRRLGDAKVVESSAHSLRGEHNAALQSGIDVLQLGADYGRGGGVIAYATGEILSARAHHVTGHNVPHLDAAQSKAAAKRLENLLQTRPTLAQAWEQDKWAEQLLFLESFGQKNWRMMGLLGTAPPTWLDGVRVYSISKKQILADVGAKYDHQIANTRLPYSAQKPPLAFPDDRFAAFIPVLTSAHFTSARAGSMNRALLLRLALRAYQLEHNGAPPPNLQALVPHYIKAVPADPFGAGEPFRYRTDGVSHTLWSIGPDGVDDGGKPIGWSKKAPTQYADERKKLPPLLRNSVGDYVAGRNH